ncbi:3-isopropylmalate dehydrogenase [Clostridium sp. DL1XJH146]
MKIAVLPGDGIGPEVTREAVKVLKKIGQKFDLKFEFNEALIGGDGIDKMKSPLPQETLELCKNSDAVLLGAVGGPKWDDLKGNDRPEAGLLKIRKELSLFANLRPAVVFEELMDASPLKNINPDLDILIVRELTGGIYFGHREHIIDGEVEYAYDTMKYSRDEIERIGKVAFEAALKRGKKVTLVDKANVLDNSRLWRKVIKELSGQYKEVELEFMYVDNAAMQLIKNPNYFDVILTGNMFGDILSDAASTITGSLGMLPSASLGYDNFGLYEPVHGSAPDIAGESKANPIATIISVAMMLKYSFGLEEASIAINSSVSKVLKEGYRTLDIMEEDKKLVTTEKMGDLILEFL